MTGIIQGVILPNAKEAHEVGEKLRSEWVVEVTGKVNGRPERNIQKDKLNGDIELEILGITILAKAKELPFELGTEINLDTKWWNQVNVSFGVRYSYLLDPDLFGGSGRNRWEIILPVNIFDN